MIWAWLLACYTEADFVQDYANALCGLASECQAEWVDEQVCLDQADESGSWDCRFSSGAAQECVLESETLGCAQYQAGFRPAVCDEVCRGR